jgi:DnaJ homolog subfamily C member 19
VLIVSVILGIVVAIVLISTVGELSPERKKRATRFALAVVFVVALVLLVRAGQPWLAAAGGVLLAGLRYIGPLLVRLLPFLFTLKTRQPPPNTGSGQRPPTTNQLTRREAFEVLGLAEGASDEEVRKAHTELIKRVHPDRGGTSYLAARVNQARDLLLPKEGR